MPKPRYQLPSVFQTKNGTYFIRPWVDVITSTGLERVKKTITLGPPEIGKREATRLRNQVMEKLNRSDYVIQSQVRLKDFLLQYECTHVDKLAASTRAKYKSHLKNHIRPAFGDLMLCEITTKRVQDWLDALERGVTRKGRKLPGISWATRSDVRNVLSSIFTKAIDWGHWQDRNPIEAVTAGRKRAAREKRKLTDEQTRRLLAALPFEARMLCCTCLFSTLRVSEVLGLQEKHLNFEAGLIQVRQRYYRRDLDVTKNQGAIRDVPMGYLASDLKSLCQGDPERFVFQVPTRPKWGRLKSICRDDRDLNQHFLRPAAIALGFYWKGFGFHSLRREAITAMGSVLGLGQAMRMAGHSSADMSILYTLEDHELQAEAVKRHQEKILGKPAGGVQ